MGNFYGVRVTAESLGCIITNGVPKRDHHRYTMADGRKIVQCFRTNEAGCILTTEKDMAKLAPVLNPAIPLYAMQISMNVQGDLHALEKLLVGNEKGV